MADGLPDDLEAELAELDPDELDDVSQRIRELAEQKREQESQESEGEGSGEEEDRETVTDSHGDELPKSVPAKASLTVKTINGNEYYYWQWRAGEKVTSKYKCPKK